MTAGGYLNDHKSCRMSIGAMYFSISCKFLSIVSNGESSINSRLDMNFVTVDGSIYKKCWNKWSGGYFYVSETTLEQ